jgi:glucan 1,3-beta-glucosidase
VGDLLIYLATKTLRHHSPLLTPSLGFFFWNFRTDMYEPQWSYMAALDRGWIPKGDLNGPEVAEACAREDSGAYRCVVKKGVPYESIVNAVAYILNVENRSDTVEAQDILHKSGPDLYDAANTLIDSFFQEHRLAGVTCDFGGLAM